MNIYFFLAGNLVAESLMVAAAAIQASRIDGTVHLVTDGSMLTSASHLPVPIRQLDPTCEEIGLSEGDVLVTGMMWPGINERLLISEARRKKAVSIVVLADIFGSPDKFRTQGSFFLPDFICVSDRLTYEGLIESGVPKSIVVPIGSLYLDDVFRSTCAGPPSDSNGSVGYLSVPNRSDFKNWGRDYGYNEISIAQELTQLCMEVGVGLAIRKHPKESASTKYDHLGGTTCRIEGSGGTPITDFITAQTLVISTYSTSLIIAKKLRRHAVSYQPSCVEPVRRALYDALGIPVATSLDQLRRYMAETSHESQPTFPEGFFFNPDRAGDAFVELIGGVL